ncbi:FAD-dependent oxidoreductase, partial [Myxococcota bacterium]|nr:FAD-dependent oxidoreductase [Myxococcota bacterium]
MIYKDVIVIGGGISGLSFGWECAVGSKDTLILESAPRLGGCIESRRLENGYWFETGAHTAYNSYGGLIQILEERSLIESLIARSKAPFEMLRDGTLRGVMKELSIWRAAFSFPRMFMAKKEELSVKEYFSKIVGKKNYEHMLSAFLAAVPSQNADNFPATMLFKKRPRRKDIIRSFTLSGGLQSFVDGVMTTDHLETLTNKSVTSLSRENDAFIIKTADGETYSAPVLALATPASVSAELLKELYPELAKELDKIKMVSVE